MRRARDDHHSHIPSMPQSIRRKLFSIGVAVIVVSAGVLSWIAISSHQLLNQTADLVTRAGQVNTAVSALLENMIDAETGQRGYLLTHRKEYLEPYSRAVAFGTLHLHELQESVPMIRCNGRDVPTSPGSSVRNLRCSHPRLRWSMAGCLILHCVLCRRESENS